MTYFYIHVIYVNLNKNYLICINCINKYFKKSSNSNLKEDKKIILNLLI